MGLVSLVEIYIDVKIRGETGSNQYSASRDEKQVVVNKWFNHPFDTRPTTTLGNASNPQQSFQKPDIIDFAIDRRVKLPDSESIGIHIFTEDAVEKNVTESHRSR
ncbi:unnamed protein product [Sphenostylis stenocarpa]|uniref:Uncharacterized protein n=1 Tax=Sphenostylis stenocarpa TaxID=92480 RepID=A0AA86VCI0_9FABA|nr:unnamed protein product [Sphenostylis stenocarpa]